MTQQLKTRIEHNNNVLDQIALAKDAMRIAGEFDYVPNEQPLEQDYEWWIQYVDPEFYKERFSEAVKKYAGWSHSDVEDEIIRLVEQLRKINI